LQGIVEAMIFRQYDPADLKAVVSIFRSNIPKYFCDAEEDGLLDFLAAHRAGGYYVVEADGEVIGAGGIALNEGVEATVSLCWGMVRSDHIGTGVGRRLTEFRINAAREDFGNVPIVLSTSQHTQGFYERFGFRLTEHTPDGFGPGIDICKMRLDD
jgi:predicted GNAT family N-acyltransferase